jgi:MFS transporter, putative metabolite:H+ symporter
LKNNNARHGEEGKISETIRSGAAAFSRTGTLSAEDRLRAGLIMARLDRLPMSPTLWRRVVLLSLGGFFEFYDLLFTGYIAPGLVASGILTPTTPGLFGTSGIAGFVAAFFSGLFLGTLLFGFAADRLGRRTIFTLSLLWYTVASVIMAFQTDAFGLNLWRFISGIGVGVELVTIDTYLAELVPKSFRGRAFAYNQAIQFMAVPVVAFLAWQLVPIAPLGFEGWRWVVLIGALGAIFVWWIRLRVPESPRWLATHGRLDEADAIVTEFERRAEAETGAKLPFVSAPALEAPRGRFAEIWQGSYLSRTVMMILFNIFQAVGFYGFANWVPTLLIAQGIEVTRSLQYTFIIAIAAPFGPLLGALLADRFERKYLLASVALGVGVFGLFFSQMQAAVLLVLFGVLVTLSNNAMSFLYHAYQAEVYPTRIRALAVGFVYSWSRLSTVFSAFVIAFILGNFGPTGVFTFIAGSMLIAALSILLLGPKVNNRSLEAISQ